MRGLEDSGVYTAKEKLYVESHNYQMKHRTGSWPPEYICNDCGLTGTIRTFRLYECPEQRQMLLPLWGNA